MPRLNPKGLLAAALSLIVLAAVIGGLAYKADLGVLLQVWARMNPVWLLATVLAMGAAVFLATLRFQSIIREDASIEIGYRSLFRIQLIALFVAHGAPISAIGDLARAGLMKLRFNIGLTTSFRLVIYDRAIGLLVILVIGVVNTLVQVGLGIRDEVIVVQALLFGAGLVFFVTIAGFSTVPLQPRWETIKNLIGAIQGLGTLLRRRRFRIFQLMVGFGLLLVTTIVFWLLSVGMRIEIDPLMIALLVPFIMLVNNLPFFYLGWGGREVAIIAAFGGAGGITEVEALAISIGFGSVFLLTSLPGGLLWLLRPSLRKHTRAALDSGANC